MDKQRCRFLLRACRPNGLDFADPVMREAIDHARADAALGAWFAREQAIDESISSRLAEVPPPPELRTLILEGGALEQRRGGRRRFLMVACSLAAALAVTAVGLLATMATRPKVRPFDAVVASAFREVSGSMALSYYSPAIADVRAWLASEQAPAPGAIPICFSRLQTIGCRRFEWGGVYASVVCFRVPAFSHDASGAPRDAVVHLFTVEQSSCSGGSATNEPMVFAKDDHAAATWRDSERFYVLLVRASESDLRAFIGGSGQEAFGREHPRQPSGRPGRLLATYVRPLAP